jgi:hypothetical protein
MCKSVSDAVTNQLKRGKIYLISQFQRFQSTIGSLSCFGDCDEAVYHGGEPVGSKAAHLVVAMEQRDREREGGAVVPYPLQGSASQSPYFLPLGHTLKGSTSFR